LNSCAPGVVKSVQKNPFPSGYNPPDYSKLANWAAHPYKKDPSDSTPMPLQTEASQDTTVDVFFLHPTTLTSFKLLQWNADLDDSSINAKTDNTTILFQASAFNEYRVFAPRYRQAHLRSYYSTDTLSAKAAFDLAYEDIRAAFIYYLKNFNQGRPIIIASHSQGTTHGMRLMKEFFDDPLLKEKLVVAYLTGMHIPPGYFNYLNFCKDSIETKCICGWRTFKAGYLPAAVKKEPDGTPVTNPLTWTTTNEYASRELNKGAVLREFNRIYKKVADAQVSGKILWIRQPQFPGSFLLRLKNYHIADINLFYVNLRENIRQRVYAYRNKPSS
jgi:hypothetical protein